MFEFFCPEKNGVEPLYAQIAHYLQGEILSGTIPENHKFPPEPELARILGTSRLTLRKGLKQLVRQRLIVQKKGQGTFSVYRPERCFRIALAGISAGTGDRFSLQILCGLQKAFASRRYEWIMLRSGGDVPFRDQINAAGADGLIVTAPRDCDFADIADPFFAEFPLVLINVQRENAAGKLCVDAAGDPMREALERLCAAGRRRIGFITLPDVTSNQAARNRSFRKNLARLGLPESPEWICTLPGGAVFESGYLGARRLLSLAKRPDAIVTAGPALSLGAWQAVMESGLRIPQDIAMVGYDVPFWANPWFSTILQPHEQVAEYAGNLLLRCLDGEMELESKSFDVGFEDRGSIGSSGALREPEGCCGLDERILRVEKTV